MPRSRSSGVVTGASSILPNCVIQWGRHDHPLFLMINAMWVSIHG
jgi:hypothetical protein